MANTKKIYNISQQDFHIMDYDRSNLVVTIAVSDFNDTDEIQLTQHDICETALAFRLIDNYYDPVEENGNYFIDDYDQKIDFTDWWSSIDPREIDKVFSGAIATMAEVQPEAITKNITVAAAKKAA